MGIVKNRYLRSENKQRFKRLHNAGEVYITIGRVTDKKFSEGNVCAKKHLDTHGAEDKMQEKMQYYKELYIFLKEKTSNRILKHFGGGAERRFAQGRDGVRMWAWAPFPSGQRGGRP